MLDRCDQKAGAEFKGDSRIFKDIQGARADRGVRGFFSRNTAECISAVTTTSTCGLTTIGCAA